MEGGHKRKGDWDSDPGVPVFASPPSLDTGSLVPVQAWVRPHGCPMSSFDRKNIKESVDWYGFVAGLAVNQ